MEERRHRADPPTEGLDQRRQRLAGIVEVVQAGNALRSQPIVGDVYPAGVIAAKLRRNLGNGRVGDEKISVAPCRYLRRLDAIVSAKPPKSQIAELSVNPQQAIRN